MKKGSILDSIDGLRPVEPSALDGYSDAMKQAVTQIVRDCRRRGALAEEAKRRVPTDDN